MRGGCACGRVRYRLASTPVDTGWCHCRLCQKVAGAPALVFGTVPIGDFLIEQGAEQIGAISLVDHGVRQFARCCGTPLTIQVVHQPGRIDVTIASLDDPAAVPPGFHIWMASAIPWAEPGDDLPRFDDAGRDGPD
ncbi:MAG: GFA family protein [Sphingomonadaceae bacterium]|nr:GFA family protein [Sphingomonadaceae bacterium]